MCAAQTATGDCDANSDGTGEILVLPVFAKWSSFTFYSNQSVGAPYTCTVHSNNNGHDAEAGDFVVISGGGALTDTNESISLNGGNFGFIWINCSAITTSVTITVNACPSNR
jgi:hypothetical protein